MQILLQIHPVRMCKFIPFHPTHNVYSSLLFSECVKDDGTEVTEKKTFVSGNIEFKCEAGSLAVVPLGKAHIRQTISSVSQ